MSISIIVPVHNEEEGISECIQAITTHLKGIDLEIICVNDGSTDSSEKVIRGLCKTNNRMQVVSYKAQRGYSYAVRSGLERSSKEYVSVLDADLQFHPTELLKLYSFALERNADFVTGISSKKYTQSFRKILSYCYNAYISVLFSQNIKDVNSLKVMRRRIVNTINFQYEYGMIDLEMLLGFKMQNIPIHTLPIDVQLRKVGKSKCTPHVIWRALIDCLKLYFSQDLAKSPSKMQYAINGEVFTK